MPDWTTFTVATVVLTVLLLILTRRSQRTLEQVTVLDEAPAPAEGPPVGPGDGLPGGPTGTRSHEDGEAVTEGAEAEEDPEVAEVAEVGAVAKDGEVADHGADETPTPDPRAVPGGSEAAPASEGPEIAERPELTDRPENPRTNRAVAPGERFLTTRLLLANVAISQGVGLAILIGLAWWTGVPAAAFGLAAEVARPAHVAVGLFAGVLLYGGNEAAAGLGERFGFSAPEKLREAMAPTDRAEWALLLGVVLPVIAVFEELLFRGALIGALSVGLGLDPWLLALVSSAAFGLGHGAQGRIGIAVTALLGFVLAALFVVSGSLLLVIVAHYAINALEFGVREGLG